MPYTNETDIPLSLAVWLLQDNYDHSGDPNTISVTTLLRPLRATLLSRNAPAVPTVDLKELIPSRLGTAIHEAVEKAWENVTKESLSKLGLGEKAIDHMVINPEKLNPGDIPIYMERRSSKKLGKFTLSGKFDFVLEGVIEDFKSTSTWAWIFQSNVDSYRKQGSMYRYLNQDIITEDYMHISYVFTDWSATTAARDKSYPQSRIKVQKIPLMTVVETEGMVRHLFSEIERLEKLPSDKWPQCTPEELWQKDTVWKYYKDPAKRARSTKNFDNPVEAASRCINDGGTGIVIKVPGEVKRCIYCNANPVCTQRENLELQGLLKT